MSVVTAYRSIANRSLQAANATLAVSLQEATGFQTYHAFESIGGALVHSQNRRYPRGHAQKLNAFMAAARHMPNRRLVVATLAATLASVRNRYLYPVEHPDGRVEAPEQFLTAAQADRLLRRVRGICVAIEAEL